MSNILQFTGVRPDLTLPLPAGKGLQHVQLASVRVGQALDGLSSYIHKTQAFLATAVQQLPDDFDVDTVADRLHEEHIRPVLLDHSVAREEFGDALNSYFLAVQAVSDVLTEWVSVAEEFGTHLRVYHERYDLLASLTETVAWAEVERRHKLAAENR